ncbi:MAG: ATP-binding protein, partial [Chitinophagaceae bacterium]
IWHILEDHQNVMWIGTLSGGLNRFDRETKKFTHYYYEGDVPRPIHSNYISVMREDRDGNLWMGTTDGLEVFNKERTKFTYYTHTNDPGSITHQNIFDIHEDQRGIVWVGTSLGLNAWNKRTKKFKRFTTEDGLPDNSILNITHDKNGNLWLTTSKGLCQLGIVVNNDDILFSVRRFTETNNVQGKFFNESACMVASDGLIYLGGSTGFNIVDPDKIVPGRNKPSLVFTNVDVFNNEIEVGQSINKNVVLKTAPPFLDEIVLHHNENIFSIEFTALDFSKNNQYAYKLEGFNKNWMHVTSTNPKATYTNLDPGTYVFKVRTTNSDGIWSTEEKTLRVVIKPPFWKTPLAVLIYILVIAGILYLARRYTLEKARMRYDVEKQRKEAERILALDIVKTKFFTNVSHEFRTPLNLILSPLERIINNTTAPEQKKQVQLVQRNAKRLLSLVNQLLDFRKMETQEFKLHPTEGDIICFARDITYTFCDIAEMKSIGLAFTSDPEVFHTYFDKDKLEKILFNLLSNAFKYTPAKGAVKVHINCIEQDNDDDSQIQITIKDTGIGIPLEKQEKIFERFFQNDVPFNVTNPGTGLGLAITREFIKLHNGTITVDSEPGKGTCFTLTMPVRTTGEQPLTVEQITGDNLVMQVEEVNNGVEAKRLKSAPVILLVEDNSDFRFYLKDNLKQLYNIIETSNGQEAWEKLEHVKPDLIVSDVMMPYMDGIELTKRIKKSPALSSVPIVLLTAVGDEEMQQEIYKLGVSDYIIKPFNFEILASHIKNILADAKKGTRKPPKFIEVSPSEVTITPAEEQFMQEVLKVIEKNMSNPEFTVEELSKELFMHRAGMYRKLLSFTGMTPLEFVRHIRLKRGRQLLEKSQMTISEIAYEVGFNNPKKFSQHFKEKFGITPSQFQKQHQCPVKYSGLD